MGSSFRSSPSQDATILLEEVTQLHILLTQLDFASTRTFLSVNISSEIRKTVSSLEICFLCGGNILREMIDDSVVNIIVVVYKQYCRIQQTENI